MAVGYSETPMVKITAKENGHYSAHKLGAEKHRKAKLRANRLERRQEGKRHAGEDGKPRADAAKERKLLQQRVDGREDECHLDDGRLLLLRKPAGGGNHHGRRDDACEGGQHVLKGHGDERPHRRQSVSPKKRFVELLLCPCLCCHMSLPRAHLRSVGCP